MKNVFPDQNIVLTIINGFECTAKSWELLKFDTNAALEMRMAVPGHRYKRRHPVAIEE